MCVRRRRWKLAVFAAACAFGCDGGEPADPDAGSAGSASDAATLPAIDATATAPDAAVGVCEPDGRPSLPKGLTSWLVGDPRDACPSLGGPAVLMMGGGADVDEAFSLRVAPVIAGGDVVVLRTSGADGYNDYLADLLGADSVETLRVDTRAQAESDYVAWAVRTAELVWLAGGDQSTYMNTWAGTPVADAIDSVVARGGVVGGTSAGLAVLGDIVYDPDGVLSAITEEVVLDPCDETVALSPAFIQAPPAAAVITDSHFGERDRLGRLLVFMARLGAPPLTPSSPGITGIGIDEATSLFVTGEGAAVVDGAGAVYVLRDDDATRREQVECGEPVVYEDVLRYRLVEGDTYDFGAGDGSVAPVRIGIDGRTSGIYVPLDPYGD